MRIQQVISIGVDPHADTISVAGVDAAGSVVFEDTVPNRPDTVDELISRVGTDRPLRWAIEGSGGLGRLLADRLLVAGADVYEVPTRLTARLRLRNGFAKTDRLDASAIARFSVSEQLPKVERHGVVEALRVLCGQRETLVKGQVQAVNRLRSRLRELDPTRAAELGRIRSRHHLETLSGLSHTDQDDPHRRAVVTAIRLEAEHALDRLERIKHLDREIRQILPPTGHRLIKIEGIGMIGAAEIIAHSGIITRFPTEGHYARYAGTAPLDASSGRQQRHRLNRWGNRTLNKVIHTAIITQLQRRGRAHHYVQRRLSEGKTKKEAIRAAKRHLTRHIYKTLRQYPLT